MTTEAYSVSGENKEAAVPMPEKTSDLQTEQSERQVPLSALESERKQRQQAQDELRLIKDNISLMQNNQQAPPPVREPMLNDDDVVTYGEFKKVANEFQNEIKMTLNELQMSKKYNDYDEVVRKYLPQVINDDPDIARTLRATKDHNLAYRLAKTSDGYRQDHKKKEMNSDAERIISNSDQSGNLSSVGGTSPISMAKRYKDMSDADFGKEMAKNLGYS